jgi:sugar phosphate isomerase/epimerase
MNHNRRKFLKVTGGIALGATLAPIACTANKMLSTSETGNMSTLKEFGLQLYTLREDLPKDPRGVLKQVAGFGYKQIESFEGLQGMFWGMSNIEFKKYMDELGMKIISSHCDISKDFEKKAAEAAAIGMKYLICPWKGPQKSIDNFKQFADEFNQKGEICKKNGIRFAYHNHDYSFKPMDGVFPQDVMMNNTDPELVDFEMDIYWVVAADQDPEAWFKKYKNRFRLCHVKDRSKNPVPDNGKNSVDVGTGSINFSKILHTARENGVNYYIVEQEAYAGTTPLKAAAADAAYLKKLMF